MGNERRLHELLVWCCGVVLLNGQNLDVEQVMVLAVEVEGNRSRIGKLYDAKVFCEAFVEGSINCHRNQK